jgi:hypothetical protein
MSVEVLETWCHDVPVALGLSTCDTDDSLAAENVLCDLDNDGPDGTRQVSGNHMYWKRRLTRQPR